jgi:hypothetical protein
MLCTNDIVNLDIDCPVDVAAGEFACVRVSNIRLDITKIQAMIDPILRKLVNPPLDDGLFDEVAKPLMPLVEAIPGISDVAKVRMETYILLLNALRQTSNELSISCCSFSIENYHLS